MLHSRKRLKSAGAAPHLEGRAVLLLGEVRQPRIQHPPVLRGAVPATCLAKPAGNMDRRCAHLAARLTISLCHLARFVTKLSCTMGRLNRQLLSQDMQSRRRSTTPGPVSAVPNLLPGSPCGWTGRLTITAAEGGLSAHLAWLRQPSAPARMLTSHRHSAAASCCRPSQAHAGWCTLDSTGSQYGTRTL